MDNQLSVGQFVAFNMFAQRVAQPIMRMAQLWTDFQQTGISVARLGDILNTRTEVPPTSAAQLPPSRAASRWTRSLSATAPKPRRCCRRHQPGHPQSRRSHRHRRPLRLRQKHLTKLVQRLYVPEQGRVLVDGIDISLIDAAQLRRQVGVVLQENLLFNRSVRENIAITDPAPRSRP
jgi:subfamily B ATP-binding cassette protein HlyB/CyaB